jgi:peptide methionine sulfoxide reductase msrA/msrB
MEMAHKINKTDKEWREILTPEQYLVLRQAGTERAFTGKYNDHYEDGTYACGACGTPLFSSETKYDHSTGWPSFTSAISEGNVQFQTDKSHGMVRTEVRCAACGSHLGHVFDDGPGPTRQHFCINSVALDFNPAGSSSLRENTSIATFAAGCFWGVEDKFRRVEGVISTRVGYTGGQVKNPTYQLVCSDKTGHAESIEVVFDPAIASYDKLLEFFFLFHDPTQINRQGPDVGTQYRSVVFYHSEGQKEAALKMIEKLSKSGRFDRPIATHVVPAAEFHQAEDYHQQYYDKFRRGK